jgi:hypothetical protein
MKKIYFSNNNWSKEIQSIFDYSNEEFELEVKSLPKVVDKISWWQKISFKREPAVGCPGLEGLVPLLPQGVDILLELRDSYPYMVLEIWALYDFVKQKLTETKESFQTITDHIVCEAGDAPLDRRSITFIWPPNLSQEQFEVLVQKVFNTREFIFEILLKLDWNTAKKINHFECKVIDGEWKINIVNK